MMDYQLGKVPPQAVEIEEAVLGSVMLEKEAITEVADMLYPEIFYKEAHQLIYKAAQTLHIANEPIDILTVTNQLRKTGHIDACGGAYYLSQLTARVSSSANIKSHSLIILEMAMKRELIKMAMEVQNLAYDETSPPTDIIAHIGTCLAHIEDKSVKSDSEHISKIYKDYMFTIGQLMGGERKFRGLASGYPKLDRLLGGFQKSDLIIVAGRPGMGKTALALSFTENIALDFEIHVGIFSMEMSKDQLVERLISMEAQISSERLRHGNIENHEWEHLVHGSRRIPTSNIYIDDSPAMTTLDIKAKARRLHQKHGIQLLIVDYIQLAKGISKKAESSREQEVAEISGMLKYIAKELDIPVIALSQLSRAVEGRGGDKRPKLQDLRESGAIEQDADVVIFPFRPEYYQIKGDENGSDFPAGYTELLVEKHRHGRTGMVDLIYLAQYTKFVDRSIVSEAIAEKTPF